MFGLPVSFNTQYAKALMAHGREKLPETEHKDLTLWLHLLACACAVCPSKTFTVTMVEQFYEEAERGYKEGEPLDEFLVKGSLPH